MKKVKHYAHSFILIVVNILVIVSVYSCGKKINSVQTTEPILITDTAKTYLALGDSYTIGESVSVAERFPNQITQLLKDSNIKISNPDIIATTGWTTADLINAINLNPPQPTYTFVSLLIGVNNQYQGRSMDEYKTEFTLLLNKAIQFAGNNKNHVFVLSIPDYSVTPFAQNLDRARITKEIDSFNLINKTVTLQNGIHYIDITPISREAATDTTLIAQDGLHPSGKQYARWSTLLASSMEQSL